jgi:cell division protein ZapA
MKNRVTMTICGEDYNFVADESPEYMQKVGSYVSKKMDEMLNGTKVGRSDAAVLAAANIADELFKSYEAAEKLRSQIKGYVDEASHAQAEASDLKREVFRLQQKLDAKNGGNGNHR